MKQIILVFLVIITYTTNAQRGSFAPMTEGRDKKQTKLVAGEDFHGFALKEGRNMMLEGRDIYYKISSGGGLSTEVLKEEDGFKAQLFCVFERKMFLLNSDKEGKVFYRKATSATKSNTELYKEGGQPMAFNCSEKGQYFGFAAVQTDFANFLIYDSTFQEYKRFTVTHADLAAAISGAGAGDIIFNYKLNVFDDGSAIAQAFIKDKNKNRLHYAEVTLNKDGAKIQAVPMFNAPEQALDIVELMWADADAPIQSVLGNENVHQHILYHSPLSKNSESLYFIQLGAAKDKHIKGSVYRLDRTNFKTNSSLIDLDCTTLASKFEIEKDYERLDDYLILNKIIHIDGELRLLFDVRRELLGKAEEERRAAGEEIQTNQQLEPDYEFGDVILVSINKALQVVDKTLVRRGRKGQAAAEAIAHKGDLFVLIDEVVDNQHRLVIRSLDGRTSTTLNKKEDFGYSMYSGFDFGFRSVHNAMENYFNSMVGENDKKLIHSVLPTEILSGKDIELIENIRYIFLVKNKKEKPYILKLKYRGKRR